MKPTQDCSLKINRRAGKKTRAESREAWNANAPEPRNGTGTRIRSTLLPLLRMNRKFWAVNGRLHYHCRRSGNIPKVNHDYRKVVSGNRQLSDWLWKMQCGDQPFPFGTSRTPFKRLSSLAKFARCRFCGWFFIAYADQSLFLPRIVTFSRKTMSTQCLLPNNVFLINRSRIWLQRKYWRTQP